MTNPYEPANPNPDFSGQPYPGQPQFAESFAPPPYQDAIDFGRAIGAPFKSPNWIMNVVWVVICFLLSVVIVGGIVLFGYQMDVIERRSRGRGTAWPDFDPNRFGEYLSRGLWPWLVNIVLGMAIVIPLWVIMGIGMAIIGAIFGDPAVTGSPIAPILVFLMLGMFMLAIFGAVMFILGPCTLRAGLANDFGQGFNFRWALDFGKRTWGQMIFAILAAMLIVIVAEVVGVLACFIGLLVTIPIAQMMITDFGAQLYDIYLTRGGEPVPVRPVQNLF